MIPEDVWYLIPAAVLLRGKHKKALTILPEKPKRPERYKYEGYREAWVMLLPCPNESKARRRKQTKSRQVSQTVRAEAKTPPGPFKKLERQGRASLGD